MLNPLTQRLLLYRFAAVEIDPIHPVDLRAWDLARLQLAPLHRDRAEWQRLLIGCERFSETELTPVISPSLVALTKLRRRQPTRPLIHCRTAFEPPASTDALRRLARADHPLALILSPSDAIASLRWISPRASRARTSLLAYDHPGKHPLELIRSHARRTAPSVGLEYREDGRLQVQDHLFEPAGGIPLPSDLSARLALHEHVFTKQLADAHGRRYVFSAEADRLEWFRRDCRRLLSNRVFCWDFPEGPDPRDPLTHFILTHDSILRFQGLEDEVPELSLDGDPLCDEYRTARRPPRAQPTWLDPHPVDAGARITAGKSELRFVQRGEAWFSYRAPVRAHDRSEELARRVHASRLLGRKQR